jgi:hypothetical protein
MKIYPVKRGEQRVIQMECYRKHLIGDDKFNDQLFLEGYDEFINHLFEKRIDTVQQKFEEILRSELQDFILPWYQNELGKIVKGVQ